MTRFCFRVQNISVRALLREIPDRRRSGHQLVSGLERLLMLFVFLCCGQMAFLVGGVLADVRWFDRSGRVADSSCGSAVSAVRSEKGYARFTKNQRSRAIMQTGRLIKRDRVVVRASAVISTAPKRSFS